jgi:hypothetical protein
LLYLILEQNPLPNFCLFEINTMISYQINRQLNEGTL